MVPIRSCHTSNARGPRQTRARLSPGVVLARRPPVAGGSHAARERRVRPVNDACAPFAFYPLARSPAAREVDDQTPGTKPEAAEKSSEKPVSAGGVNADT